MGYRELTGSDADMVEVLNLDEAGQNRRELVDQELISQTKVAIREAGESIRNSHMPRLANMGRTCESCDLLGLCRSRNRSNSD